MPSFEAYRECRLCPRQCAVDRTLTGRKGYCGESDVLRISYVGPHFGEEPPITGKRGSGTVFFSGCSLRCTYCQNYQISQEGVGRTWEVEELASRLVGLSRVEGVHNVNFVTADHFLPHALAVVELLRKEGEEIPVVFNLSGYQSDLFLDAAGDLADIYLPDYKYSDETLAGILSRCRDYPSKALDAITKMVRQKGFLNPISEKQTAKRGVLVRHLILPGHVENSINALTTLYLEFGSELPLSLMSQYYPVRNQSLPALNRGIAREEFYRVYEHCLGLGFENMFVQFPEEASEGSGRHPFVPDFTSASPFGPRDHSSVDNDRVLC